MRRLFASLLTSAALVAVVAPTPASADPDELIPCKRLSVRAAPAGRYDLGITRVVCRGTFALPSPGAAPISIARVGVNVVPPGTFSQVARQTNNCVGLGIPAGSAGYKCKDNTSFVLIKPNLVKAVVKVDIPSENYSTPHPYPPEADVAVRITTEGSSDTKNYCGRFGGPPAIKNTATLYTRRDAPAPAACSPSGAFLDERDLL
jgi:hypothetical protein